MLQVFFIAWAGLEQKYCRQRKYLPVPHFFLLNIPNKVFSQTLQLLHMVNFIRRHFFILVWVWTKHVLVFSKDSVVQVALFPSISLCCAKQNTLWEDTLTQTVSESTKVTFSRKKSISAILIYERPSNWSCFFARFQGMKSQYILSIKINSEMIVQQIQGSGQSLVSYHFDWTNIRHCFREYLSISKTVFHRSRVVLTERIETLESSPIFRRCSSIVVFWFLTTWISWATTSLSVSTDVLSLSNQHWNFGG